MTWQSRRALARGSSSLLAVMLWDSIMCEEALGRCTSTRERHSSGWVGEMLVATNERCSCVDDKNVTFRSERIRSGDLAKVEEEEEREEGKSGRVDVSSS